MNITEQIVALQEEYDRLFTVIVSIQRQMSKLSEIHREIRFITGELVEESKCTCGNH